MNWRAPEWRRSSLRRAPRDADLPDVAAVAVFAAAGAPVAPRSRLDIVGFLFVSCLTALGGGIGGGRGALACDHSGTPTGVPLALRAGALAFGWRLPVYRSRPPRPENPKR
jgi:uncharacterized membrane protein YeiH